MQNLSSSRKIANVSVPAIGYGAGGIGGIAYGTVGSDEERLKVGGSLCEIYAMMLKLANTTQCVGFGRRL